MTNHTRPRPDDRPGLRDWLLVPALLAVLIFGIPILVEVVVTGGGLR